jgi:acetyl esterase/lipase
MNNYEYPGLILSLLSLLAGICLNIRFPPGLWGAVFWIPKLLADAWSPLLAMIGFLGVLAGLVSQNYWITTAGLVGAFLGIRHIHLVSVERDPFSNEFEKVPTPPKRKRYALLQPNPPKAEGTLDINLNPPGETDDPLLADLWQPTLKTVRTGLAVIYLHGGLWQAMDKGMLTQPLFRRLADQGHVILDVAYPLTPKADLYQMLVSVKRAILWMKNHAQAYSVNPDKIVLMGVSGGGHLALMAAYAPDHPAFTNIKPTANMKICGVVSLFGITDMSAYFVEYGMSTKKQPEFSSQITAELLPKVFEKTWLDRFMTRKRLFPGYRYGNMPGGALILVGLMGGTLKEYPELYRMASPITYANQGCPPTLQIFDDNDFVIDTSHGRKLHEALCKSGSKSIYIEYPQTVHGFDQYFGVSRRVSPSAQAATFEIERFLNYLV